jgi:hypothetical protein
LLVTIEIPYVCRFPLTFASLCPGTLFRARLPFSFFVLVSGSTRNRRRALSHFGGPDPGETFTFFIDQEDAYGKLFSEAGNPVGSKTSRTKRPSGPFAGSDAPRGGALKENVKEYFRAECHDILSEEEDPELRARVLEAMKEGFSELIEEQHDVPIPDSAVDEAHAAKEHAFRKLHTS